MKLTKINDKVYYIPNATNIGCILNGDDAILIDTGWRIIQEGKYLIF
ncbi:hypothetical protein [Alkaliphilus sp. B6464]|nr:hypothetical protein [Alkaliphilus sp. B6464]QUH20343.1 hypothetical protein HYG84_10820 [Alkaliphilus sp. B6464]